MCFKLSDTNIIWLFQFAGDQAIILNIQRIVIILENEWQGEWKKSNCCLRRVRRLCFKSAVSQNWGHFTSSSKNILLRIAYNQNILKHCLLQDYEQTSSCSFVTVTDNRPSWIVFKQFKNSKTKTFILLNAYFKHYRTPNSENWQISKTFYTLATGLWCTYCSRVLPTSCACETGNR